MIPKITIQDIIKVRLEEFGKTWLEVTQDPEKVIRMVEILSDFHNESMKLAYQFGLESKQELLVSNFLKK